MQQVGDEKYFLLTFKTRLQNVSLQGQDAIIRECHKNYLSFSTIPDYELPFYLQKYVNISDRRLITLIRTKSLPIRNNLFRMKIVEANLCTRCLTGEIEDEINFFFSCHIFDHIRKDYKFLKKIDPHMFTHKLNEIALCNSISILYDIVNFIRDSKILTYEDQLL